MFKAINQIEGVDEVLKGKGKGTSIAYPGDIFDDKDGESLVDYGAASLLKDPVIDELDDVPKKAPAKKAAGKKAPAKKAPAKKAAAKTTPSTDDDLGLD